MQLVCKQMNKCTATWRDCKLGKGSNRPINRSYWAWFDSRIHFTRTYPLCSTRLTFILLI